MYISEFMHLKKVRRYVLVVLRDSMGFGIF